MKLLVISAAFPPMQAGEADHVYHICENLAQRGFDLHVITTQGNALLSSSRIEVRPIMRDWSWRDLWRLRREVRLVSPDAVLLYYIGWIYNYHPMITFMPAVIKKMNSRIRIVTQFANAEGADPAQFSIWARALRKCLMWWATPAGTDYSFGTLLRDSDALIVLSRIHGDRLAERCAEAIQKMVLVPPPPILKMCEGDAMTVRELERKRLRLAPEEFVFVYLGYVYPGKGVETLLDAFRIVSQKYSNTRLIILGGTIARQFPDRPRYVEEILELLKQLAVDDKVIWLGQYDWDSDQASICLRAVDASVIPVQGGVQLNNSSFAAAVAHALPVIATRGRVVEDAFVDRENVLLCPPKDAERLAEAMETLIADSDLASRLRKGALEMAAEWFSWSKATDRTISVLRS